MRTGPGLRSDLVIVSSAHDVADARLHRIAEACVAEGLSVVVAAKGRADEAPQGCRFRQLDATPGLRHRVYRALRAVLSCRGRALLVIDPDLIPLALVWGWLLRRPVVIDVHEDYSALLKDRAWAIGLRGRLAGLVARAATAGARRADLTVVADEHVPPASARRRLVIRNVPRLDEMGSADVPAGSDGRSAVYVGDVRSSRGLRTMVEAVLAAPPWTLDIIGPVTEADLEWLRIALASTDRVRAHGRLPKRAAWDIARGADVGLVLLEDTEAFRAALPTKVLEYLAGGLAVVTTPLPRTAELVLRAGAGVVADSAEECAAILADWHTHPDALRRHKQAALLWAQENLQGATPFEVLASEVGRLVAATRKESHDSQVHGVC